MTRHRRQPLGQFSVLGRDDPGMGLAAGEHDVIDSSVDRLGHGSSLTRGGTDERTCASEFGAATELGAAALQLRTHAIAVRRRPANAAEPVCVVREHTATLRSYASSRCPVRWHSAGRDDGCDLARARVARRFAHRLHQ